MSFWPDDDPPRDEQRAVFASVKAKKFLAGPPKATVILGDSVAKQWPVDLRVPGCRPPVMNIGIGGDRIEDIAWRLRRCPLDQRQPAAILLIAGNNNLMNDDASTIIERFITLIEQIQAKCACTLMVTGIIPRGVNLRGAPDRVVEVNSVLKRMSNERGFIFATANDAMLRHGPEAAQRRFYVDNAHLNRQGYVLLARAIAAELSRATRLPAS